MNSKLDFDGVRLPVSAENAVAVMIDILTALGCDGAASKSIARHLAAADLGPRQIGHDGDGPVHIPCDLADRFEASVVFLE